MKEYKTSDEAQRKLDRLADRLASRLDKIDNDIGYAEEGKGFLANLTMREYYLLQEFKNELEYYGDDFDAPRQNWEKFKANDYKKLAAHIKVVFPPDIFKIIDEAYDVIEKDKAKFEDSLKIRLEEELAKAKKVVVKLSKKLENVK